jgi:2-oxoglutarate ferredoxin oxidoreductase subunit delta
MAKRNGLIVIDRELCKGCYLCIAACPNKLIIISDELNQMGYYPAEYTEADSKTGDRTCNGCTTCALVCPDLAIEVYRE